MSTAPATEPHFEIIASRHFATWLAEQQVSLAFTHPPQKVFLIGLQADGRLSIFERTFPRCLGIAAVGTQTLYVSSRYQIWRLENALPPGQSTDDGYDRLYIPRKTYTTGYVNIHDIAVEDTGRVLFVNTRFGCLAEVSDEYSFTPVWLPPHLPQLLPGDRCHLNGLAVKDGRAAYVSSVSETDVFDSWRDQRQGKGVAIDITTKEVVVTGMSMPHSPRWYRDRLWLTNSGTGLFGCADLKRGTFETVAFAPGFLRGLCFVGDYAVVGSSKPREGDIYSGLGLSEKLEQRKAKPRLGLFIVDLRTGEIPHWLFIESDNRELYDVVALPGVRQPMALGLLTDEIEKNLWFDPQPIGL
jgi:uncharacterized protein (TIGR03032 family)